MNATGGTSHVKNSKLMAVVLIIVILVAVVAVVKMGTKPKPVKADADAKTATQVPGSHAPAAAATPETGQPAGMRVRK